MSGATLRIVPREFVVRRPQRMLERHIVAYRRQWLIVVSGFFEPLFYLLSIRAGLGSLVGTVSVGGQQVPYDMFVAPALMASSAMNGAIFDSTGNVLHRLKYARFLAVMAALGLVHSWWVLMALPACALIGLAFASVGFAGTTYMRSWSDMDIVTTVTMPLFLFSATFFPTSAYGSWAWIVQLSPLYHGVALVRAANAGVWTTSMVAHIAVLAAVSIVGLSVAARRLDTLLRK